MSLLETILKEKTASPIVLNVLSHPKELVPVIADEPARWFFEENEKEYWDQREEFRNLAPPFPAMWFEFKAPKFIRSEVHKDIVNWDPLAWKSAGVLLIAGEADAAPESIQKAFPTAKWIISAYIFTDRDYTIKTLMEESFIQSAKAIAENTVIERKGFITPEDKKSTDAIAEATAKEQFSAVPDTYESFLYIYGVNEDGSLATMPNGYDIFLIRQSPYSKDLYKMPMEGLKIISHVPTAILNVAMLSVYFMHAKGTELKTKHVPEKLRKARDKKRKKQGAAIPHITFKVLDIGLGMRQALDQAKQEGGGLSKALHLRRGHFKVFKKPMFGKGKTGDVWVRPHWVGQEDLGEVKKTYRVKKPETLDTPKEEGPKYYKNPFDASSEATGVFGASEVTGAFDFDSEATGMFITSSLELENRIGEVVNWKLLAELASHELPGSAYMMQRALIGEFSKRPDLKNKLLEIVSELIEGAENRMIGNYRSRKLRRRNPI